MKICKKCGLEFKQYQIIDSKQYNFSKRVYCLTCSPIGKRHRDKLARTSIDGVVWCGRCKIYKPTNQFYKRKNNSEFFPYCKQCSLQESKNRQWKFKQKCVDYKGGVCVRCGYNKCLAALDFHHIDPTTKLFCIVTKKDKKWSKDLQAELDKCELICANCHREHHATHSIEYIKNKDKTLPPQKIKNDIVNRKVNLCPRCQVKIDKNSKLCIKCYHKTKRKTDRPSLEQLVTDIQKIGYCGTGKKYGVSDNCIRKWIRIYKKHGSGM